MKWLAKVNPCPLCGNKERIERVPSEIYRKVKKEHGSGMVTIECGKCNVSVASYGYKLDREGIPNNYRNVFNDACEKWNRLTEGRKA